MNKYTSEVGFSLQSERRQAKIIGVTKPNHFSFFESYYLILVFGILIGLFVAVAIFHPELINWQVFNQSFIIGLMMGMR